MNTQPTLSRFKRINVGVKFTHDGEAFRKISGRMAFKLKPNGAGETHNKITFPKNTFCEITP